MDTFATTTTTTTTTTTVGTQNNAKQEPDLFDNTMQDLQKPASASIIEVVRKHLEQMRAKKTGNCAITDCCLLRLNKDMTMLDILTVCYMNNGGIVLQTYNTEEEVGSTSKNPSSSNKENMDEFEQLLSKLEVDSPK
jgi:hypothetical protein